MDHHCNHISLHCFRVFAFLCLFATLKWSRLLKMTLLNFPKSKGAILDRFWFPSSFPCFALVTLQVPTWYKSKNNWTCRHSIWMLYLMWTTPLLSFTGNENVHGLYDVLLNYKYGAYHYFVIPFLFASKVLL